MEQKNEIVPTKTLGSDGITRHYFKGGSVTDVCATDDHHGLMDFGPLRPRRRSAEVNKPDARPSGE